MAFVGEFGSDLANAERDARGVRNLLADFEAQMRGVEIWSAHLIGPPEFRMSEFEFRELLGREFDDFGCTACEFQGLLQQDSV